MKKLSGSPSSVCSSLDIISFNMHGAPVGIRHFRGFIQAFYFSGDWESR
jgi:hypothetical protein